MLGEIYLETGIIKGILSHDNNSTAAAMTTVPPHRCKIPFLRPANKPHLKGGSLCRKQEGEALSKKPIF
jgi:hypothetical protein